MTKQHFIFAASIVRNILDGLWTPEFPPYGDESHGMAGMEGFGVERHAADYTRAVWTAEAFISLAAQFNPRFDQDRFLIACGLKDKPAKVRKSRARKVAEVSADV